METSKTPNFDALLDPVLEALVPHVRTCPQQGTLKYCEDTFKITKEDIEFLKSLRVPAPTLCPTCRRVRRFAFLNNTTLYKRPNNAPGKSGNVVSWVPPVSPLTVYDVESYRTVFEPYQYATSYDATKSFFEQFYALRLQVPQPAIIRDPSSVNSEYSLNGRNLKNGYCVSGGWNSEDVWYSINVTDCREIMDCYAIFKSEQCYECVRVERSHTSSRLFFSENCIGCRFLYDCRNCQDCFGCVNLRNKRYCWFNEQLSQEEYESRLKDARLESRKSQAALLEKFWAFVKTQPVRAPRVEHSVNVSGIRITDSKDCHDAIVAEKSQHERHVDGVIGHKDSMDIAVSGGSEKLYETIAVGSSCANVKFSFSSKFVTDSEFVINCRNIQSCFACIGLENKSYCIFNRQYEKEEYYRELGRIKTSLFERGEYGEFFPYRFSTFAYNGSSGDNSFPLTEKEAAIFGMLWQSDVETDTGGLATVAVSELPDSIGETDDSILEKAIICEETGRPFRIVPTELAFYRKHNVPLPTVHPYQRMRNRYQDVGDGRIHKTSCESCKKNIDSMYNPADNWILYCDECYQRDFI